MWLRMEGVRPASRSEDRMAAREMKRATDARKSLVKREVATVALWMLLLSVLYHLRGNNRAVNGRQARWITSGEGALSVSDGRHDHLSLMLTQSSAIAEVLTDCSMAGSAQDLPLCCNTMRLSC